MPLEAEAAVPVELSVVEDVVVAKVDVVAVVSPTPIAALTPDPPGSPPRWSSEATYRVTHLQMTSTPPTKAG